MSDITFKCIHCNQPLEAPGDLLGEIIDCPACHGRVVVGNQQSVGRHLPHIAPTVQRPAPRPRPQPASTNKSTAGLTTAASVILVIVLLAWARNYFTIQKPVADTLRADSRNSGYKLTARFQYYILSSTLILDLTEVDSAAPVDLFRGLFQSAEVFSDANRRFDKVILARSGTPTFMIDGSDFSTLGSEFGGGQNPIYLVRTLPEILNRPDGRSAYGTWEGGILGVMGKQMEDVSDAAQTWAGD